MFREQLLKPLFLWGYTDCSLHKYNQIDKFVPQSRLNLQQYEPIMLSLSQRLHHVIFSSFDDDALAYH